MSTGLPLPRVEARAKVTGAARYAVEHSADGVAYGWIVTSTVARGRIEAIDTAAALAAPEVVAVITHENAPRLQPVDDHELRVLQAPEVSYRGQIVGVVVAESLESAREAAALVRVDYAAEGHDVLLVRDHPKLYRPEKVNPNYPTDTSFGDFDGAFAAAEVRVDVTYTTPAFHNNPMEPHATLAVWDEDGLTLYESSQGAPTARAPVAKVLGLADERVRVVAEHVGGGFGSKGTPRPHAVLAAVAAQVTGRPVKLAVTRQQMFQITGYRTPTVQRMRLGADADGRLVAIGHDVQEQTSTVREFAEQTATPTRVMYAGANRRTTHLVAALDVPTPSWMRAPGECPGMYALESAMDELAVAAGIDPVALRVRNDPEVDPEEGVPFSSRNLVACLREGAARFGWDARDPRPSTRREGRWLVGSGVASSTYPARCRPAQAFARAEAGGRHFVVGIGATDIGTGARTVLTQVAAETLGVEPGQVTMMVGDSALPHAPVAGGSAGTASWGSAVQGACRALRAQLDASGGPSGTDTVEATYDTTEDLERQKELSRHAFGAQFVTLRVDVDSGEIRVDRLLGVFAAGRILNPRTARSQFIGGMTMGMAMALMEESVVDLEFGDYLNHDLAQYHVPVNADIPSIEAHWIDEEDPDVNPLGVKGIGEIGIVGTAAAVGNAFFHATGVRIRDLPLRPDRVLGALG
ncbi:xanthine dehydrogenase family protein molybdopterin-binding subunit [Capillimicrobium parvum]|uniref:Aldehyde oxidoreductase molybdenum-binding subunit PaoC n=1 Tax=Capillimicrobium parvum TaxID=2884022 RepID=A0A9E6Y1E4_9ACTN|nr:xanthine dehydrogenase family protein molybdopterin-binding subunit [Capillimicrobium parvum]UGS38345.1 Aldehyde oxidoreductase molybdenum-binding subunit PaoC [Capillimicrobium parvum]